MSGREERSDLHVGGQAVIEGVMMRSPAGIATAVRRPGGEIIVKSEPFVSLTKRSRWLNIPIVRGAIVLVETFIVAMKALSFSAEEAATEEEKKKEKDRSKAASAFFMTLTIVAAFALGFLVFFYIPLFLTELLHLKSGFVFNLIDGFLRLLFIFLYILLITRWKEMQRVFEYHGAEHKTIYAFEADGSVDPRSALKHSRLHPRCSTSFLLIVVIVSVIVFIFLGKPQTLTDRLIRFSFIPLIAGLSYEVLKLSARPAFSGKLGFLIQPGLLLQRLTTREPSIDQIEVAVAALEACLEDNLLETRKIIN